MRAQILDGSSCGPGFGQRQKWPWSIVKVFREWMEVIWSWKKTEKEEMLVAGGIKLKERKRNHLEATSNLCSFSPLALLWFSKWLHLGETTEIIYLVCLQISWFQWWIFVQTLFFRTYFWYWFILPFLEWSSIHYLVGKHEFLLKMYSFRKFFFSHDKWDRPWNLQHKEALLSSFALNHVIFIRHISLLGCNYRRI